MRVPDSVAYKLVRELSSDEERLYFISNHLLDYDSKIVSYILALDSDNAGYNGTNKIAKALTNKLVVKLNIPNGKDINDLSKEEFENLYEEII